MTVRLTDDEAWAALAAAHTGVLTTLRADGTPVSLPVWFAVVDRRIYVSGPSPTKKFVRIRRDPRCSFLVESGRSWAELRAVHVSGTARVVDDPDLRHRVDGALDEKYRAFRTERADMSGPTRRHYEVPSTTIEIVPDGRILSWDNRRLGTGRQD